MYVSTCHPFESLIVQGVLACIAPVTFLVAVAIRVHLL